MFIVTLSPTASNAVETHLQRCRFHSWRWAQGAMNGKELLGLPNRSEFSDAGKMYVAALIKLRDMQLQRNILLAALVASVVYQLVF